MDTEYANAGSNRGKSRYHRSLSFYLLDHFPSRILYRGYFKDERKKGEADLQGDAAPVLQK